MRTARIARRQAPRGCQTPACAAPTARTRPRACRRARSAARSWRARCSCCWTPPSRTTRGWPARCWRWRRRASVGRARTPPRAPAPTPRSARTGAARPPPRSACWRSGAAAWRCGARLPACRRPPGSSRRAHPAQAHGMRFACLHPVGAARHTPCSSLLICTAFRPVKTPHPRG